MRAMLAVGMAYALGCVQTGYYLVKARTGRDLRQIGSGSTGARNAGRVLGKTGFMLTLLGDVLKGTLAVAVAGALQAPPWAVAASLPAVAMGHVWPIQLGFSGGRGVAVGLGALAVCDLRLLGVLAATTLVAYAACRRFQASGLVGFALLPAAAWTLELPREILAGTTALSCVVLFAHRTYILQWLQPLWKPCAGTTDRPGD